MCYTIVINGDKEIESPNELKDHFGFDGLMADHHRTIIGESCLCQIDIERTLTEKGILFTKDSMQFHITE